MLVARQLRLSAQGGRVIDLVDLVGGEVGDVDVRVELRLEGGPDLAQLVPDHAAEEGVVFDLLRAAGPAEAVRGVAEETAWVGGKLDGIDSWVGYWVKEWRRSVDELGGGFALMSKCTLAIKSAGLA